MRGRLKGKLPVEDWLSGMDSNHDKGLQRPLCYHYTTGQAATTVTFPRVGRKEIFPHTRCCREKIPKTRRGLIPFAKLLKTWSKSQK